MMRCRVVVVSLLMCAALPKGAPAEDAQAVLEKVRQKQIERWEGVQSYMIDQSVAGNRVQLYFERVEVTDAKGEVHVAFRPATAQEIAQRQSGGGDEKMQQMTPETMEAYAQGLELTGKGLGDAIEDGLEDAGLPRGLLAATGTDPWATLDPRVMMGGMAVFARAAAAGQRQSAADPSDEVEERVAAMAKLVDDARLVGIEKVDGHSAFHIRAEGLDQTQKANGEEFTINAMSFWIDKDAYVPLRFKMEGVAESGGETRPMVIEKQDMAYEKVPGSEMYEPRRHVMRIGGVMNAEQEKQMQEAQQKMAEFEEQMKQMPAAQRDMIMRQMGPQMEMMKKMASGGGFEVVTEVHEIRVIERTEGH